MKEYTAFPSAQKIEKVCAAEGCDNIFLGHRRTLYCKECRYKVSHNKKIDSQATKKIKNPRKPKEQKTYIAHCPCGRDYTLGEQEARKYAMVNGKIYKYCPKCEWKRGQFDVSYHNIVW